jgi:pimeloyl-ACP methyl ester carboxylesterase
MATQSLEQLQLQAIRYFSMYENGFSQEFPQEVVRELLRSEVYDGWAVGLYLLSTLQWNLLSEYYFDDRTTYAALGTFVAASLADQNLKGFGSLLGADDVDIDNLIRNLQVPGALAEQVFLSFREISDIASQYGGTPAFQPSEANERLAIIVHGTWATKKKWWQPNIGNFWKYIKPRWPHLYAGPAPFWWSGADSHSARESAGRDLVRWANLQGVQELDAIAHSHGGNVCLVAAQHGLKIRNLILLGTPIRTEFMLNLGRIQSIKNVFSISDWVQLPGAMPHTRGEGRTLGDSSKVSNRRAEDDGTGRGPGHSDLHEPATWQASNLDSLL